MPRKATDYIGAKLNYMGFNEAGAVMPRKAGRPAAKGGGPAMLQ